MTHPADTITRCVRCRVDGRRLNRRHLCAWCSPAPIGPDLYPGEDPAAIGMTSTAFDHDHDHDDDRLPAIDREADQ